MSLQRKTENWIDTVHRNFPFIEIFVAQWEVGGRGEDRKNKKVLKGWDKLLVPLSFEMSQPSACWAKLWNLYLHHRAGKLLTYSSAPPSTCTVPCLAPGTPKPGRPYAPTLEKQHSLWEPFPPLQDYSVRYLIDSPHLLEVKGGGSVWLYLWPWQLFTSRDSWVTNI